MRCRREEGPEASVDNNQLLLQLKLGSLSFVVSLSGTNQIRLDSSTSLILHVSSKDHQNAAPIRPEHFAPTSKVNIYDGIYLHLVIDCDIDMYSMCMSTDRRRIFAVMQQSICS